MPDSAPDDSRFWELYSDLTATQKKVINAWLTEPTKKDAAEEVGMSASRVYEWPDRVWEAGELLLEQQTRGLERGLSALSPAAIRALERALDPDEETSRPEAKTARYLVNALRGKPTQRQEISHEEGGIPLDNKDERELNDLLGHLDEEDDGTE
jgi:transposase